MRDSVSRVVLYNGDGLAAGTVKDIGQYKIVDAYITADTNASGTTCVCMRCARRHKEDVFRGLSGSGFGSGDMRIVGATFNNNSGDSVTNVLTTAIRIKNNAITTMDERKILTLIGIEKF